APEAPQTGLPVIVIEAGKSNEGCTVTGTSTWLPRASRIVSVTVWSVATVFASIGIVVDTVDGTGNTVVSLENALKGSVPLVIVTAVGTPEYAVTAVGSTVSVVLTTGANILFGAPLPPPQ